MRKLPVALSVIALATVALTGCATGEATASAAACDAHASDGPVLGVLQADGELGTMPKITMPANTTVPDVERETLIEGTGRQIIDPSQVVSVDVAFLTSAGGDILQGTEFSGTPVQLTVAALGQYAPPLVDQLLCTNAGSRVAVAVPYAALAPDFAGSFGIAPGQGMVAIVDVMDAELPHAEGSDVFNGAWGLPSVVRAPNGHPGVIIPDGAPPAKTTVQTLIKGHGPTLNDTDSVILQYTGVTWNAEKDVFDSTWENGSPIAVPFEGMPAGFADALTGATVGSQFMIVLPAGSIPADQAGAAPTDTAVVYVVDVLGTLAAG